MVMPFNLPGHNSSSLLPGAVDTSGMMTPAQHPNQQRPNAPFMYQAQQTGPTITGNPLLDQGIAMLAPLLLGIQQPKWRPQLQRGISPLDAMYGRDVNTPLLQQAQGMYTDQVASQMSGQIASIASNFGIDQKLGRSPTQIQQGLTELGQGSVGRMIVQAVSQTSGVQSVMGGNPMELMQKVVGGRHNFTPTGAIVNPLDLEQQAGFADYSSKLSAQLLKKSLSEDGMTPNYDYTRGFKLGEIGEITSTMAGRDMSGMRLGDPDIVTRKVGEMTKVLEAVTDITGGGSVKQLFQQLDQLVGSDWPKVDPSKLRGTLREISATAKMVGTSTAQFAQDLNLTSSTLGAATGVKNMTGAEVTDITTTAHIIARNEGRDVQEVIKQQTALAVVGAQSQQGKDLYAFQYMRERGAVSDDLYDRVQQSIVTGSKREQQQVMNEALAEVFGSTDEARRYTNDPAMMAMMRNKMSPEARAAANQSVASAQNRELDERSYQETVGRMDRMNNEILRQTGGAGRLTADERIEAKVAGSMDYLEAQGKDAAAGQLQDTYDRVLSATGSKSKALAAMNRAASHIPGVTARDMADQQKQAVVRAQQQRLISVDSEDTAVARAEMQAFRDQGGLSQVEKDSIRDINKLRASKDPGAAADANAAWDVFKAGIGGTRRDIVDTAGETERERVTKDQRLLEDTAGAAELQRSMLGAGMSTEERRNRVGTSRTAVMALNKIRKELTLGAEYDDPDFVSMQNAAIEEIRGLDMDPTQKNRLIAAAQNGNIDSIDAAMGSLRLGMAGQDDRRTMVVDDQLGLQQDMAKYRALLQPLPDKATPAERRKHAEELKAFKKVVGGRIQGRGGISEPQREAAMEAVESGDIESVDDVLTSGQTMIRELGLSEMAAAKRTQLLDHSDAVRSRQRATGMMGSIYDQRDKLAEFEQKVVDSNQHLRDTMPQRALRFLSGDTSFADVLGIDEGGEAEKAIRATKEGKALFAATEKATASADKLKANQKTISDISKRDDVNDVTREQIDRAQKFITARATGGVGPEGQEVTALALENEIEAAGKLMAGQGMDEKGVVADMMKAMRAQTGLVTEHKEAVADMAEPMKALDANTELNKKRQLSAAKRSARELDETREFNAVRRRLDTDILGGARLEGMKSKFLAGAGMREDVALLTGMSEKEIKEDPQAAHAMLAGMSAQDVKGLTGKKQEAFTNIAETFLKNYDDREVNADGSKRGKGDKGDGSMTVTGTLVMLDRVGNQVGVGEDVHITKRE